MTDVEVKLLIHAIKDGAEGLTGTPGDRSFPIRAKLLALERMDYLNFAASAGLAPLIDSWRREWGF